MVEEQLFHQALEYPPAERVAFLASRCGEDLALRNRVAILLQAHENPGGGQQVNSGAAGNTTIVYDPAMTGPKLAEPFGQTYDPGMIELKFTELLGQTIGPYRILSERGT